jgi:hypothetical protein
MSVMYGKPLKAFPEQDHDSHIAVHMQFLQDPMLGGNNATKGMQPIMIAHIAEHVALLYRQRMEASIGVPMQPVPDFKNPNYQPKDINPELDRLISQRAAQVVRQSPQMQQIDALKSLTGQQQQQQNPLQYAQQLAKLEADALKARTQAQIQADQAKAQSSIQIKQAEAEQDLQIEATKAQADLQAKITKLEADLQLEREKNNAKLQMEMLKNAPK